MSLKRWHPGEPDFVRGVLRHVYGVSPPDQRAVIWHDETWKVLGQRSGNGLAGQNQSG